MGRFIQLWDYSHRRDPVNKEELTCLKNATKYNDSQEKLPVQSPGWYTVKFARRWHISRWNTQTLSYVVPLEEHTGSSNDGQLSTQMHRASLGPNALHTAKYLQETLMHGSRSVNKWYAQQFKMSNLGQIKCKFIYCCRSERSWSERTRQLSNRRKNTL